MDLSLQRGQQQPGGIWHRIFGLELVGCKLLVDFPYWTHEKLLTLSREVNSNQVEMGFSESRFLKCVFQLLWLKDAKRGSLEGPPGIALLHVQGIWERSVVFILPR